MGQEASSNDAIPSFSGELAVPPRGPLLTAFLAMTGVLLVIEAASLVGRYVLGFQRPAEVKLTPGGLEVRGRTLMLGRLLREHSTVIPREGIVRITREVRYPRLAMYAGLIALAIGSYLGVGLVVDGVRAASPSMLGTGLVIAMLGLGLDFAFSSLVPGLGGRTRVVLVPRRGGILCVSLVDPASADQLLNKMSQSKPRTSVRPPASVESAARADPLPNETEHHGAGNP
jgi:hypothetical protein